MTPWDLIAWALAAGAAIMIIGLALSIVFAVISPTRSGKDES